MPRPKRNRKSNKVRGLTKTQYEKLSKRNAKRIMWGTDKLKSRGNTGWYYIERLNKWMKFRSNIEANAIQALDAASDYILDFDSEPFIIEYKMGNSPSAMTRNYVPDFIAKTNTGKLFVIEIKPASQLREEKNVAKWKTAKTWCWNKGARFLVITEKDVDDMITILQHLEKGELNEAQELMKWSLLN